MSKNIYQRLNAVMSDVTSVFKGTEVSMGGNRSYSAVSHDDVTKLVHMPLVKNGIFVEVDVIETKLSTIESVSEYQGKQQTKTSYLAEVTVQCNFVNIDDPKDRFSVKSFAYALDTSDKAVGKAQSMAVKYIYLKNLLLESTDEEESREYERNVRVAPKAEVSVQSTTAVNRPVAAEKAAVVNGTPASRGSFRKNPAPATTEEL